MCSSRKKRGGEVYHREPSSAALVKPGEAGLERLRQLQLSASRSRLAGVERDFMRTSYHSVARLSMRLSPDHFPGQLHAGRSTAVNRQSDVSELPRLPTSISTAGGATACGLAPGPLRGRHADALRTVVPDQEQWSAFLRGSLALGKDHTAYARVFLFAEHDLFRTIAPSPEGGLTMPNDEPVLPRQRHHAGYQPGAEYDAADLGLLAYNGAWSTGERAGKRYPACGGWP